MQKILIVDDDKVLVKLIADWLVPAQFGVDFAFTGVDAKSYLDGFEYAAIILDWNLPDATGLDILRYYRQRGGNTPILMLTGKADLDSKEIGFHSGADDYLTKPFQMRELLARVKALTRRSRSLTDALIGFGDLQLDLNKKCVFCKGARLDLAPRELDILELLLRHPAETVKLETFLRAVWPSDECPTVEALRTHVHRLRKTLEVCDSEVQITASYKIGYSLQLKTPS